jgi:Tfp pilus assembly protein PilX
VKNQHGASLITAIFLITALAILGSIATRLITHASIETANEYMSAQALSAAESGIEFAAYQIATGNYTTACQYSVSDQTAAVNAWFDVTVDGCTVDLGGGRRLYIITSTGKAGGSSANPIVQRQIISQYIP